MRIIIKKKKRFLKIFIFISALFFFLFAFVSIYNIKLNSAIKTLSKTKLPTNTGCIIKTLGQNTETVSANISFYTPNSELIRSYERAWQGWQLKIEAIVLPLNKGTLVFPHRVFSGRSKYGTGIVLFSYYKKNNYPAIYDFKNFSDKERKAIKTLFGLAKFPYLFKIFSESQSQTLNLRNFKQDKEYILSVNKNKEIYFRENN